VPSLGYSPMILNILDIPIFLSLSPSGTSTWDENYQQSGNQK